MNNLWQILFSSPSKGSVSEKLSYKNPEIGSALYVNIIGKQKQTAFWGLYMTCYTVGLYK